MKKLIAVSMVCLSLFSCMKKEDLHIDLTYTDENLRYINCPLGGIGTGNITVNGYGAIQDIEIFNRPSAGGPPPYMTFFSLYTKQAGQDPVVRVLERESHADLSDPFGKPRQQLDGLPHFKEAVIHNAYPLLGLDLHDDSVPLDVSMTAWSPFIPTDPANSSIPAAVMEWELFNPGEQSVSYSIAFSMGNPMRANGEDGHKTPGGCTIIPYEEMGWKGFTFSTPADDSLEADGGSMRVLFPDQSHLSIPLCGDAWVDDAQLFWKDFSEDGRLVERSQSVKQTDKQQVAAMHHSGKIAPGDTAHIPFLFMWHIPYRITESYMPRAAGEPIGVKVKNNYAERYGSIDVVTKYLTGNLPHLSGKTEMFSEALITSSVPPDILDAAISNLASLKTNLLMQDRDGNIQGFEGLGDTSAYGPGNCTHVWNYAQSMAALFPSLERNVRESGFGHSTFKNGFQGYRTRFPLSNQRFENVAVDGQMGNILRVYREWKLSGDNAWLGGLWPDVKNALKFAWTGVGDLVEAYPWMENCSAPWDPNKEGLLRGEQYTTYGIHLYGPNMMTGSLYLGALKACSEMAMAMNEPERSLAYNELYRKGRDRYMELLWNGEYFVQKVESNNEVMDTCKSEPLVGDQPNVLPKYQIGDGCLSDQLLGQYLGFVSGLGYLMDTAVTKQVLESIYRYNFKDEIRTVDNVQRIFAAFDEPGLVNCSWPAGNRPALPLVCADEVWSGVEYQVATSLLFTGLVKEGLEIVKGVRSRYDGSDRNPFAEIESGRHHARALSSWSVYQAMAGYHYDGTKGIMNYAPAIPVLPIRYFWSTSTGWGTVEASRAKIHLKCLHGTVHLNELGFVGYKFFSLKDFRPSVKVNVDFVPGKNKEEGRLRIRFPDGMQLEEGEDFRMDLQ